MCMLAIAATDESNASQWKTWSSGAKQVSGSAIPFHKTMSAVQECKRALSDHATLPGMEAYRLLTRHGKNLRSLLTDTFPGWTHRMQMTQDALPDAREEFVYGLYCALRGHAYGRLAQAVEASPDAVAQAYCNAAHLCHVAADLTADEDLAISAHAYRASMMQKLAEVHGGSSTGCACAMLDAAVTSCAEAGLPSDAPASERARLRSLNAAGLCEPENLDPRKLVHVALS